MNQYAPEPDYDDGNTYPTLPVSTKRLTKMLKDLLEYTYSNDAVAMIQKRDPLYYRTKDDDAEDGSPQAYYSLHGRDISMEATLCQFWSGEHDNAFMSEYVCMLLNIGPSLIREVLESRKKLEQFERGLPDLASLREDLKKLTKKMENVLP